MKCRLNFMFKNSIDRHKLNTVKFQSAFVSKFVVPNDMLVMSFGPVCFSVIDI